MAYTPQQASKRAYKRFKRDFHNRVFSGYFGFVRFALYWFTIRRAMRDNAARR